MESTLDHIHRVIPHVILDRGGPTQFWLHALTVTVIYVEYIEHVLVCNLRYFCGSLFGKRCTSTWGLETEICPKNLWLIKVEWKTWLSIYLANPLEEYTWWEDKQKTLFNKALFICILNSTTCIGHCITYFLIFNTFHVYFCSVIYMYYTHRGVGLLHVLISVEMGL